MDDGLKPLTEVDLDDLDDGNPIPGIFAHRLIAELRALREAAKPMADMADADYIEVYTDFYEYARRLRDLLPKERM